jgi:hypothetical protein
MASGQSFGVIDTFTKSFGAYLKHWWVYALLGVTFLFVPLLIGGGVMATMAGGFLMAARGGQLPLAGIGVSAVIGILLFYLILFFATSGLAAASTHASIQSLAGRDLRVGDSIKVGFKKIVPVFLLTLLFILIIFAALIPGGAVAAIGGAIDIKALIPVGFILAYVGMIFVALGFYVAVPVKVAEDKGIIESLTRSWRLTAGYRWQILGLLLLFVLALIVVMLVGLLLNFIPILGQIIFLLLMLAIMPFGSFIAAAIYQRLMEIKEGKSVTSIAEVFN